jgi:hypothetical protein
MTTVRPGLKTLNPSQGWWYSACNQATRQAEAGDQESQASVGKCSSETPS